MGKEGGTHLDRRFGKLLSVSLVIVLAALLAIPITGLTGTARAQAAQDEETVLRVGFMQYVDSLNPMVGLSDAAYVYYGLVYDTFHTVENNFDVIGNLAVPGGTRPVPLDDPQMIATGEPYGSVWEYDLTMNARWHDGEPFTIEDAVWNINLNADDYESMWAYQPYAFYMRHAEAVDQDTLRIHYFERQPDGTGDPKPASYAYLLCIPMLPRHKLQDMTAFSIAFNWTGCFAGENPEVVGTGPFTAEPGIYNDWKAGDKITLIRNDNYHWGEDRGMYVKFDKIELNFYSDSTALSLALRSGDIDIAQLPPQSYRQVKEDVESGALDNVITFDGLKCTQYWTEIGFALDETSGVGNKARFDPAVRQALAMATNKQYIVNTYYAGLAEVGTTLISPVNEWHYEPTADELIPFDIAAANQKLEDAGYRFPEGGGTVREVTADSLAYQKYGVPIGTKLEFDMLIRQEYPEEREIANYLVQQWLDVGVHLDYLVYEEVAFSTIVYSFDYDCMIWYWSADADPNFMLFCQSDKCIGGWSDNAYNSPRYNENYSKSVEEMDPVQRRVYTDNCQRINYEDCGYIILAYAYQTYACRTDNFKEESFGDWEAYPCQSFDHFWTGPQLMFMLEPVGDEPPPPPDGDDDDGGLILYVGIGAGVAVAVIVIFALLMTKKGKGGVKPEGPPGESPLGD